jgi:hypothetical protein
MQILVEYLYDTDKREFVPQSDQEDNPASQDTGYFRAASADGKEWESSTFHGKDIRVRYDGPVDQLAALAMRGGAELVAALNGDDKARYLR